MTQPKYRSRLPQLSDRVFLTDGGMETTFVFLDGIDLPCFAAFDLLKTESGTEHLRRYYETYARMATRADLGFVLESATWRANPDWGRKLGYSQEALAQANRKSIDLLVELRWEHETVLSPMVISGAIGPRGDGYRPDAMMGTVEAENYHAEQIAVFRTTAADMVSAFTLNYVNEAIGIARAARAAEMPVALSFTLETDGRLPTGETLGEAIMQVDAATHAAPAYYMINCAHPEHFADALDSGAPWVNRLRGLRANASKRSHAELDVAPDLDAGDPAELGRAYGELRRRLKHLTVLGGCCGTDHRHVEQICFACEPVSSPKVA